MVYITGRCGWFCVYLGWCGGTHAVVVVLLDGHGGCVSKPSGLSSWTSRSGVVNAFSNVRIARSNRTGWTDESNAGTERLEGVCDAVDVVWVDSALAFETRPHTRTQTGHLLLTDPESKYRVFIYFTEALLPCLVCWRLIRCWFGKTVIVWYLTDPFSLCVSDRLCTGCVLHLKTEQYANINNNTVI